MSKFTQRSYKEAIKNGEKCLRALGVAGGGGEAFDGFGAACLPEV